MRVDEFLARDPAGLIGELAVADARRFRRNEPQQIRAWGITIGCLRAALQGWAEAAAWALVFEFPLLRLGRRLDVVLVTPRAVVVLEFKAGAGRHDPGDRSQVEDYAVDLQDFHAASRDVPIIPVLVATAATDRAATWALPLAGAQGQAMESSGPGLGDLLRGLWAQFRGLADTVEVAGWEAAAYRPVPGIIDAARTLYGRHDVLDIRSSRADLHNLSLTSDTILRTIAEARAEHRHIALFVTGIPGAGKTLCGLNAVFAADQQGGATFLTGNPTLVHVLRAALVRDAVAAGMAGAAARQRAETSIQALPGFRDHYVARAGECPAERVIVVDEAQRCWSADYARAQSRAREVPLTESEPGHLLDIMARQRDWAVIVCLIGNGQEIHTGEGGLAEWGVAIAARPNWRAAAPARALDDPVVRQRLPPLPGLVTDDRLHLDIPVRSIRNAAAAAWVDAVIANDTAAARGIAQGAGPLPFRLVRDLPALRAHLRAASRGLRRCGLVASSGAKRLRADGLGAELPHMDRAAVANWFLDRWPDVRASDALEMVATEFSCQGLELDFVGLCWGGDMIRAGSAGWQARQFRGTKWERIGAAEKVANRLNTYRVLLTRARYETVIWVPRGYAGDATRNPAHFTEVATFLRLCGVQESDGATLDMTGAAPQTLLL